MRDIGKERDKDRVFQKIIRKKGNTYNRAHYKSPYMEMDPKGAGTNQNLRYFVIFKGHRCWVFFYKLKQVLEIILHLKNQENRHQKVSLFRVALAS